MNIQSIPPLVIAGVTFYVGFYHLLLYSRLPSRKEHFSFALICLCITFYDIASSALYNVTTMEDGMTWQRAQMIVMCVAAVFCFRFVHYHNPSMPKKWVNIFTVINLVMAGVMLFERSGWSWTGESSFKRITLPFGHTITYIESAPGPLTQIFFLVEIFTIAYILWTSIDLFRRGQKEKGKAFLVAFIICVTAVTHDSLIVLNVIQSFYIIEYGFLALILLMAYSLTSQIVQAAAVKDALKESESRFATVFRSNPGAMSITRADDGTYVDVNDNFLKTFGFTREEVLGETCLNLDIWADPHEQYQERDRCLMDTGRVQGLEFSFRRKDGSIGTGINSAGLIELNGLPHFISITYDVTEQKQAQEETKRLENQLQQAQKMEAIGTMASGIAHDFNNILQTITGFTQVVLNQPDLSAKNRHNLVAIERTVDRASDLTQQLLTFGRRVEPQLTAIDLNQTVQQISSIMKQTLPDMIGLDTHLSDDLLPTQADTHQLERVLLNLGANARDAMPDGGRISIKTQNCLVDDQTPLGAALDPGPYVRLTFSDTGQGMDQDTRNRIFEPFFTTKASGRGTGLGMSMVYGIVTAHGGQITCQSHPGQGTTFNIYLPVNNHPPRAEAAHCIEDDGLDLTGSETILLVDDEESIIETARELLDNNGYHILTADSGEKAVDIYQNTTPHPALVILDLGMPGMGGYNCLSTLLKVDPAAKVLIISGYAGQAQIQEVLNLGAAGFVAKPFKLDAILKKVRDILDSSPFTT